MKKMGYQPEEVREELEKQSFNNVTAIYLLLADPKTQLNLPAHSFVRSGRESKTEQSTPSHKSVAEGAEQSAPNLGVLTTDSSEFVLAHNESCCMCEHSSHELYLSTYSSRETPAVTEACLAV